MGSNGSRLDIIADVLRAVSQGAKKTQITYASIAILTLGDGSAALFSRKLEKNDSYLTRAKTSKPQSSDSSLAF